MAFRPPSIPQGVSLKEWLRQAEEEQFFSLAPEPMPTKIRQLLSSNESVFLTHLLRWFPHLLFFSQVQLIRLVEVDNEQLFHEWLESGCDPEIEPDQWRYFNDIRLLSLDFVACVPSGVPLRAIELNGKEHENDRRVMMRDRIKKAALLPTGLPFLTFKNEQLYSRQGLNEIEFSLRDVLG